MTTAKLLVIAAVWLYPWTAESQEIPTLATLSTPTSEHAKVPNERVDYVQWAGDKIVCGGHFGFLQCFDPQKKLTRWTARLSNPLRGMAVAPTQGQLYALDSQGSIHTFNLADGKKSVVQSASSFARKTGKQFATPTRIAWMSGSKQLFVATFDEKYGENGFLFNAATFSLTGRIKCSGFLSEPPRSDTDGRFIVTVSPRINVRIWDTKEKKDVFVLGKDEPIGTDMPFVSNAAFDGKRTLVYVVDGAWVSKGQVHVLDVFSKEEKATFGSRNGNAAMDVDFVHDRIALTGTDRGLVVVNLAGEVIAERANVALQRNVAIAFSPDGKRLAVGSMDGTMRVFDLEGIGR